MHGPSPATKSDRPGLKAAPAQMGDEAAEADL